jgi:hypothetical protein
METQIKKSGEFFSPHFWRLKPSKITSFSIVQFWYFGEISPINKR